MNKKAWIAAMLGAAAMAMSSGALAQRQSQSEIGWYAGFSLGQNDDFDDEFSWRISGGYQINRNVAVEFGYASLGEKSAAGVTAEASAWDVIGLYKHPLQNQLWIYGLAGFTRAEAEAIVPGFGKVSDTTTDITFGFGVQYDYSRQLAVRGQFQDYDGTGVISVGVAYKF